MVVGAQVMQAVGFLAYAVVTGPAGVFTAAALVATGVRFFWSAIFTALADHAESSAGRWTVDTWYSVSNGARTAGLAVGGLGTGLVVADGREATYRAVACVAAACFASAAGLIAAFVRAPGTRPVTGHPARVRGGYATLVRDRPFLGLTVVNTVFALSSIMLGLALPAVVLTDLQGPAWLTAAVLAGNAALIAVLAAPVGTRLPRYRRTRVVALAAALWVAWAAAMAVLGPVPVPLLVPVLVASTLLFTVAELLHAPASTALAASAAPAHARGRYLAVFQYSFTVASIIAPAFFSALFEASAAAPWLTLALLNAASLVAVLAIERRLPAAALLEGPRTQESVAPAERPAG